MHKLAQGTTLIREGDPLFEVDNLSFRYPSGPLVLHNINLSLYQGDRLAIAGANGSGKSTFAKHLCGLFNHDSTTVLYKGHPLKGSHLAQSRFEIGLLFQDPDDHLFCNTLYEDVAFGPLNQGKDAHETEVLVHDALAQVKLLEYKEKPAHLLSYGQKKRAALAAILAMKPETLVLDEPTVNLDSAQVRIITELLKNFQGTLICISHDLLFLKEICQKVLVLKQGTIHHDHSIEELWEAPTALREHGLDFSFRYSCCEDGHHTHPHSHPHSHCHCGSPPMQTSHHQENATDSTHQPPLLQLSNFSYIHPNGTGGINTINLTVQRGERIALIGENGAGKSTLASCLAGIIFGSGSYIFDGQPVTKKTRKELWKDVGIIFQDSADQLFCPTCAEEVAFGLKQRKMAKKEIKQKVGDALAMVHLEGFENRVPLDMSGGERKRLAIASVICLQPKVLIMDEPTAGLDPQGEEMFFNIIKELNMTQILISHDLYLIARQCQRVLIMNKGAIVSQGSTSLLFKNDKSSDLWNLRSCELRNSTQ